MFLIRSIPRACARMRVPIPSQDSDHGLLQGCNISLLVFGSDLVSKDCAASWMSPGHLDRLGPRGMHRQTLPCLYLAALLGKAWSD